MDHKEQLQYQHDLERMRHANDYTLLHMAEHLQAAGQHGKLFSLLTSNRSWLEAKFNRFANDGPFLSDVQLALDLFSDPVNPETIIVYNYPRKMDHKLSSKKV
jgi:hypothetical protein